MSSYIPKVTPLDWPSNRVRCHVPVKSRTQVTLAKARTELLKLMERLGFNQVVLSSNAKLLKNGLPAAKQPFLHDTGVAVWFRKNSGNPWIVMNCDLYDNLGDNLRSIGLSLGDIAKACDRLNIFLPSVLLQQFALGVIPGQAHVQPLTQAQAKIPATTAAAAPIQEPKPDNYPPYNWRCVLGMGRGPTTWSRATENYRDFSMAIHKSEDTQELKNAQMIRLNSAKEDAERHFKIKPK